MTEAQLQRAVIKLAQRCGWRVAHFTRSRTSKGGWATPTVADAAGFPDLVLTRESVLLFVELKADAGYVKPAQREWHEALSVTGHVVLVWKPKHWREGVIEETLR